MFLAWLRTWGVENAELVHDWTIRLESVPASEQTISATDLWCLIGAQLGNSDGFGLESRYPELTSALEDMLEADNG